MDDGFVILEVLGSGAHSTVCLAHRRQDEGVRIALKVLKRSCMSDAGIVRRFRDEAKILRRLDHPSIIRVHRLLDYDGRLVQEMEYVQGSTLEALLESHGPLPVAASLEVAKQVASALDSAFNTEFDGSPMRILHRDLKPANIMIRLDGRVTLLDFGIAKGAFLDRQAQSLHNVWGTVGYDAPERRNERIDTSAADVYALGATLFVLLTHKPLLLSLKSEEKHDAELHRQLTRLEAAEIPKPVGDLLRQMIAFDRHRRPQMPALIEMLDTLVGPSEGDLVAFATERVAPTLAKRMKIEPAKHLEYGAVKFVEERSPSPPLPDRTAAEADTEIRKLMAKPGWVGRMADLERVLLTAPQFNPRPFMNLVGRATVPAWQFWNTPAKGEEVEAALLLLAEYRTAATDKAAETLLSHRDERIANAAKFLLDQK
jgi:serine/threonine-protein kinase